MPLSQVPAEAVSTEPLHGRTVAVLGYGAQGRPHALNLRDSGLSVIVAQRGGSPRHEQARQDGFTPLDVASAARGADLLIFALPDDAAPDVFAAEVGPHLRHGQTLGFIHGYAIRFGRLHPPADVDVVLVAPKAQGRGVRRAFLAGGGPPCLIAVHQDATGRARQTALAWAAGLGSARSVIFETTFAEETETDLFGEQAVLCGGMTALVKAAFETLVEAGYPEELAYFECCHELKLLVDLLHEGGISHMRRSISSVARFGDLTRGPRVAGGALREELRAMLDEIRSGRFAAELEADRQAGSPRMRQLMQQDESGAIERAGEKLRRLMGMPARDRETPRD